MDFADRILGLVDQFEAVKADIKTEEATKMSMVMPLLQALGYNVFNPNEVVPEYVADIGEKKGEKVDYAIMDNGIPVILIEAKACGVDLNPHGNQLKRYFGPTLDARFAILTNGIEYRFYSDFDHANNMDTKPFLVVQLQPGIRETTIKELKKFHKDNFDSESILDNAQALKYTRELKNYLRAQLNEPEEDFLRFLVKQIYDGTVTKKILDRMEPIVIKAFGNFVDEMVSDQLNAAYRKAKETEATSAEPEVENLIVTTNEEIEGYHIIKAMLRSRIDADRIQHKDTQSYFGIMVDGNIRKWFCRLFFDSKKKFIVRRTDDGDERINIESLDDLYGLKGRLEESLGLVDQ